MGGGVKRHRVALPKGRDRDGTEVQPGDEVVGAWPKAEREKMDAAFTERMESALRQRGAGRRNDESA